MPRSTRLISLALFLTVTAHAELELTCEIDGRQLPIAEVTADRILVRDQSETIAAPENATWRLDGNLRANAGAVCWTPVFSVERNDDGGRADLDPARPTRAIVSLNHVSPEAGGPRPGNTITSADWPEGLRQATAAAFAWLVDGRPTQVIVTHLPPTTTPSYSRVARFSLTPEEGRGFPVLLLWMDGGFLPPSPVFAHAAAQRAMIAAMHDDVETLRTELASGLSLFEKGRWQTTIMHCAAEAGATGAVAMLLEAEKSLAWRTCANGASPLEWAAVTNRGATVRCLLAGGAPNDLRSDDREPLLHTAVKQGNADVVRALLEGGVAIDAPDGGQRTALHVAVFGGRAEVADILIAAGAGDSFVIRPGPYYLNGAVHAGHTAMVRWLLARGADPNRIDRGETALLSAAAGDASPAIAQVLGAAHADPDLGDPDGMTPLMIAAAAGRKPLVETLLAAGAGTRRVTTREGATALHLAARFNQARIIACLLDHQAERDALTKSGATPLDMALLASAREAASVLSARGARIAAPDSPPGAELIAAAIRLDLADVLTAAIADGWSPRADLAASVPAVRAAEECRATACLAILRAAEVAADETSAVPIIAAADADPLAPLSQPPPPEDPRGVREKFPEHIVRVEALVDTRGAVFLPHILATPDARLGPPALEVARQWHFAPPTAGGQPAVVRTEIPVRFAPSTDRVLEEWQAHEPPRGTKALPLFRTVPRAPGEPAPTMTLRFTVDAGGRVADVRVLEARGIANLDAFVAALRDLPFRPARCFDEAVAVRTTITVPYKRKFR